MEITTTCVSVGSAHCRERLQNPVLFSSASIQRGESHSGGSRAGSGNGTRSRYSLKEGGHWGGSSSRERVRFYSQYFIVPGGCYTLVVDEEIPPDNAECFECLEKTLYKCNTLLLISSKEEWRVASHFRSVSVEPLSQQTEVQDAHTQTGSVSDQVRGLFFFQDRSKRCILPCLHPSHSQEVPEVCFWGWRLTPHFYKVCGYSVSSKVSAYSITSTIGWFSLNQSRWRLNIAMLFSLIWKCWG